MSNSLKILTAGLLILGSLAFFIGEEATDNSTQLSLTFEEFDSLVMDRVATISPVELADYLMKQAHHYNLIDLQGDQAIYQIPTSEAHTIDSFLKKNIPVNESIILYATSEIEATQLYFLLVIRGYFKVKVLSGGIEGWYSEILQPSESRIPLKQLEYRKSLTNFFGGSFNQRESPKPTPEIKLDKIHKQHKAC